MLLSYLHHELLLENITKLRPHLEKMVRDLAEEPHNTEIRELAQDDKWVSQAVDWVLQADPKAFTSTKPPERTKSPFAKTIIKWWMLISKTFTISNSKCFTLQ